MPAGLEAVKIAIDMIVAAAAAHKLAWMSLLGSQSACLRHSSALFLQVDLWSTGVILYELFTGQPPFFCNNIYDLCKSIMHSEPKYPKTMSPAFKSFLQVGIHSAIALDL